MNNTVLRDTGGNAIGSTSNHLDIDVGRWSDSIAAANIGVATDGTPRVTIATDDAVVTAVQSIDNIVGTDAAPHGASQQGSRALGTDGTNDQQIAVDATGNVQVDIVADAAGLALAANQLSDGHNVTVDNAAGATRCSSMRLAWRSPRWAPAPSPTRRGRRSMWRGTPHR